MSLHIPVSYTHLDVYKRQDLVDSLKISAFEGHGSTFAVLPDGRVVLDSSSEDMRGVHLSLIHIFLLNGSNKSGASQKLCSCCLRKYCHFEAERIYLY